MKASTIQHLAQMTPAKRKQALMTVHQVAVEAGLLPGHVPCDWCQQKENQ